MTIKRTTASKTVTENNHTAETKEGEVQHTTAESETGLPI